MAISSGSAGGAGTHMLTGAMMMHDASPAPDLAAALAMALATASGDPDQNGNLPAMQPTTPFSIPGSMKAVHECDVLAGAAHVESTTMALDLHAAHAAAGLPALLLHGKPDILPRHDGSIIELAATAVNPISPAHGPPSPAAEATAAAAAAAVAATAAAAAVSQRLLSRDQLLELATVPARRGRPLSDAAHAQEGGPSPKRRRSKGRPSDGTSAAASRAHAASEHDDLPVDEFLAAGAAADALLALHGSRWDGSS
jgi:hypothetical protein